MNKKKIVTEAKWDMLDYFKDPVYATSYDSIFLYANDAACHHWGKKREEIVGYPIFTVFPQAKGTILEDKRRECLDLGKQIISEFYFPSPPFEGWYEIIHSPFPEGIITRFKLISEKTKASASIDFLYEFIMMFLNQLQEPVVITDLRYKIKEGNSTLIRFCGVPSKSSLIGHDFFEKICQGNEELVKPVFKEVFISNKSRSIQVGDLQMTISTIFDYFDLPLYYIIFLRRLAQTNQTTDENQKLIVDKENTAEEARKSMTAPTDEFYHNLWNQSGLPTAVFNKKGDLVSINDSMNELFSGQINLDYNLLNDTCISEGTRKKIRNNQIIQVEKYFKPEITRYFFMNKTTASREEYNLDVLIKPFYHKNNQDFQGYVLTLIDRMEHKKKKEIRHQLFEKAIESLKKSTNELKDSLTTLLIFVKDEDDKKFLTQKLKIQKQLLSSLMKEVADFQKAKLD